MATLAGQESDSMALIPVATDSGVQTLATSKRFTGFKPGTPVVVASTQPFHMLAGDDTLVVTTAAPKFLAGVYKFKIPDACTAVAMIDSSDGAGSGQVYRG